MGKYLLKIFENEKYQNDFLNGDLYMNTLKKFKEYDKSDTNRSDKFEALISNQKPDLVQIGKLSFPKKDCGFMKLNSLEYDYCNLLCMYKLWMENENDILSIDSKNKEFGSCCVIIHNVNLFLKKITEKTDSKDIVCHYNEVKYINKNKEFKNLNDFDIPFTKFSEYKYQREFRIAIDTKRNVNEPYILNIGDIRNICEITTIEKINQQLKNYYLK